MKEFISVYSSIATLILFLFYFIGRTVTILSVKRVWKDKVILGIFDSSNYQIVDTIDIWEDDTTNIRGVLISKEGIRHLKVFSVEVDENYLPTKKGSLLYKREFLNIDEAIEIRGDTGELFPTLIIEYEAFDYMKISLEWRDNLKNGVYSEMVVPQHTLKSFLYYLLK